MFIFIILFLLLGILTPTLLGWFIQYLFPVLAPMSITAYDPAGFWWGLIHGMLAPANAFLYLIGRDVLIVAAGYQEGNTYIVGFIIGILIVISPKTSKSSS